MPAPAEARRSSQLKAVLRKNVLLKRRAWKTSCCEILSPALFLSILVLGYYLSDITYIAAANYSMTTLFFGPSSKHWLRWPELPAPAHPLVPRRYG